MTSNNSIMSSVFLSSKTMRNLGSTLVDRRPIKRIGPVRFAFLYQFIATILLLVVVSGCKQSTVPQTGTIAGNVILINDTENPNNDPIDYSNIRVLLYKVTEVDSILTRLNTEHPSIGVQVDQSTSFVAKDHTPVQEVSTVADGGFTFQKVKVGSYNIVFEKEGWGSVQRYNVRLDTVSLLTFDSSYIGEHPDYSNSSYSANTNVQATMYPIQTLDQASYGDYTFRAEHSYYIPSDVFIQGNCVFEGGSFIYINSGKKMNLFSTVSSQGEGYTRISGSDETNISNLRWDSICVYSSSNILSYLILDSTNSGIVFYGEGNTLDSSIIRQSTGGSHPVGIGSVIRNVIFSNISNRAIVFDQSSGSDIITYTVEKSIFIDCMEGLRTLGNAVSIKNNYFVDNELALFSFSGYHEIHHNCFDRNYRALICAGSLIPIEYNDFYAGNDYGILFSYQYYSTVSNPLIKYNNFYQTQGYAIELRARTTSNDVNAQNNFWKTQDIGSLLWDQTDDPNLEHSILYLPKQNSPVASAGIQ